MTRPIRFRSVVWRGGENGEPTTFSAVPPTGYAGYLVTGTLRIPTEGPPILEVITITDKDSGAQVQIRGELGTLTVAAEAAPPYVSKLWKDARYLAGIARRTRPSEQEVRIQAIVAATAELGGGASRDRVADALGRSDEWGEPNSDYKRDVAAAGGFEAIRRRARDL